MCGRIHGLNVDHSTTFNVASYPGFVAILPATKAKPFPVTTPSPFSLRLGGYPPFSDEITDYSLHDQICQGRYSFPQQYWKEVPEEGAWVGENVSVPTKLFMLAKV